MSVFSIHEKRETKIKFAFQVYDVDGDGFIDSCDLFHIIQLMVGNNLKQDQIQVIVDQTILDCDTLDMDGRISLQEFKRSMFAVDFDILTIQIV